MEELWVHRLEVIVLDLFPHDGLKHKREKEKEACVSKCKKEKGKGKRNFSFEESIP